MDLLIIVLWICAITLFSCFGAYYAKKYNTPDALIGLYVAFVLISNIIAFKVVAYDFGFAIFFADAATLVFSVTFLLTDLVNEKFGRKETQKMILIAFVTQLAVNFFIWLALMMPSAPFWTYSDAFNTIFGFAPRLMIASWISFLICENVDAYVFDWFKKKTKGKQLWMRNVFSSLPAMFLDSIIFTTLAFYGVQPLFEMIIGLIAVKWLVGIINIPFMYLNRWIMYKK
jgi:uncharacterized integral membrane protein (TIGR00697 family)